MSLPVPQFFFVCYPPSAKVEPATPTPQRWFLEAFLFWANFTFPYGCTVTFSLGATRFI